MKGLQAVKDITAVVRIPTVPTNKIINSLIFLSEYGGMHVAFYLNVGAAVDQVPKTEKIGATSCIIKLDGFSQPSLLPHL